MRPPKSGASMFLHSSHSRGVHASSKDVGTSNKTMISRIGLRAHGARRSFKTSAITMNSVYGSPKTGIYSNLPFKVKNRKVPFGLVWWGTFGFFFAFPFLTAYRHLKKSGSLA